MSNTNITTPLVQPSQNDLNGGVAGDGNTALEKYMVKMLLAVNPDSYFLSGGILASTAANLVSIVPAGVARISGYYVSWPQTNVTLPASSTSHLFVALTFASGLVTGVQIIDNITGTPPSDSLKLGTQTTNGTAITSAADQRTFSTRLRRVVISAPGTTNWTVPSGVSLGRFRQWGAGGGGAGGGGGSSANGTSGGNGGPGHRGGYLEALVTLIPGSNVVIINGSGGSPGSAGASEGGSGGGGGNGGTSSITGTGFSFTNPGGNGGDAGGGAGSSNGAPASWGYRNAIPTASAGTLDVAINGGGNAGGPEGAGGNTSGSAGGVGSAGSNAVTIIEL